MRGSMRLLLLLPALSLAFACEGDVDCTRPVEPADPALAIYNDPGLGAWEEVAREDLAADCGLDPDVLDAIDDGTIYPYAIVRYGLLCHEHAPPEQPGPEELTENYSATKTLGAAVVGRAVRLSADLPEPLLDTDRMDRWVGDITFNPDALVAHVLAMIGYNESLAFGERVFAYDGYGSREINRLSDVVESVIAQAPSAFSCARTTGEFAEREFFEPLGMNHSEWAGEVFGVSWHSNLRDMARLGLLLAHEGVWAGKRLLDASWVYKMTHPSFEDANTGYGYLTWLGANYNHRIPGVDRDLTAPLGTCQPPALWSDYPHGVSESLDCNYADEYPCDQTYDGGVFGALGAGGQLIVVHPALDLVIVTKNAGGLSFLATPWQLVRDALIEIDPVYQGDRTAFCEDYAAGEYAPDLILAP